MTDLWTFYLVAIPAVLMAGISKGGFGSGASFAGAILLALVLEPQVALALMLPLLMLMDVTALSAYWRQWDPTAALVLCLGAIPGTILGLLLFQRTDANTVRLFIGAIAVLFVFFEMARSAGLISGSRQLGSTLMGGILGIATGFTSFMAHAGGPAASVYLLSRRLSKRRYQATTVFVFWVINLMKILPYYSMGAFDLSMLWIDMTLVPVAVLGIFIGVRLHDRISDLWYFRLTYALLLATGTKLIFDGLTA
ncbi:sulfite exporter TauE/SafE family protein [Palleronia caenipelagi]|uniref:Probable membrane transporter protein n=1 Tax=Palleronia caenipelagi TaxID=2489174 RepID=A0A547Q563_9RHOB|nr:sulfite exporter TauE/SafE family protein [Palleronia caenipelagi]TRD21532.1 sulfite exporter TauE/SafE family protein [Palleronia caenipelagi]